MRRRTKEERSSSTTSFSTTSTTTGRSPFHRTFLKHTTSSTNTNIITGRTATLLRATSDCEVVVAEEAFPARIFPVRWHKKFPANDACFDGRWDCFENGVVQRQPVLWNAERMRLLDRDGSVTVPRRRPVVMLLPRRWMDHNG